MGKSNCETPPLAFQIYEFRGMGPSDPAESGESLPAAKPAKPGLPVPISVVVFHRPKKA